MKILSLRVFILLSALLFATALPAQEAESDVTAVMAADHARGAALLAADTKALAGLLAEDLRYTHSNGKLETKAIHLGTITDGLRYERFVTSEVHGQVIVPGVVVLTGKIDQRKLSKGKGSDSKLMFQAVWRRDGGVWRLASMQTATLPTL